MSVSLIRPDTTLIYRFILACKGIDIDLVLHVAEKAFLRGVVPAVPSVGHGLAEIMVSEDLDEAAACIV